MWYPTSRDCFVKYFLQISCRANTLLVDLFIYYVYIIFCCVCVVVGCVIKAQKSISAYIPNEIIKLYTSMIQPRFIQWFYRLLRQNFDGVGAADGCYHRWPRIHRYLTCLWTVESFMTSQWFLKKQMSFICHYVRSEGFSVSTVIHLKTWLGIRFIRREKQHLVRDSMMYGQPISVSGPQSDSKALQHFFPMPLAAQNTR